MRYLIVICLFLFGCGSENINQTVVEWSSNPESGGVMYLGDSIAYMFPSEYMIDGSYNRGISGETTYDIENRLWLVNLEKPDVIYLFIGINNLHTGLSVDTIPASINNIINGIDSVDTQIFIISMIPSIYADVDSVISANSQTELLCEQYSGVYFIDIFEEFVNNNYSDDGVHPNKEGYIFISELLSPGVDI